MPVLNRNRLPVAYIFLLSLSVSLPALAADPTASNWTVTLGGGVMISPEYEGGKEFGPTPLPYLAVTYKDWFSVNSQELSVRVLNQNGFRFELLGGYELGRSEDDADHLDGLGDVDFGGKLGGRLSYEFGKMAVFAQLDKSIGGSDGLTGKMGITYEQMFGNKWILGASASTTFADNKHMDAYFSVTPRQSARSGLQRYEADAGLKSAQISASATYLFNQHWFLRGEAELGILLLDAADSPIVERNLQPSVSLLLGYRF
ncbi:MipA/OmpV family protein [Lacibacterium aquatile]|uniref:MipA/OmpV family protein n=1 Tax=Lacibacterium aquatile TaxID=1168082 RepID=A0ABW5DTR4_9PROT